ncbi:MAG: hypothetical protein M0036_26210 [Desulfobacteraceae bacterium]|nr:hypothetical protein [Desulfobacteraceae bacterium]
MDLGINFEMLRPGRFTEQTFGFITPARGQVKDVRPAFIDIPGGLGYGRRSLEMV